MSYLRVYVSKAFAMRRKPTGFIWKRMSLPLERRMPKHFSFRILLYERGFFIYEEN